MKTRLSIILGLLIVAAFIIPGASAVSPFQVQGSHYNLNIIGTKSYDETLGKEVGDSMGHTLFVKLNGKSRITMTQAIDGVFRVTDRNGCDGQAAFNIAPGHYNVYARALGTPNGKVNVSAWGNFTDLETGYQLINLGYVNLARESGKPQSVNINSLFYVDASLCTAVDEFGACTETTSYNDYWVFDIAELFDYWWDYDNNGLKNLQVRFYECTLDPTGTADDYCRWGDGTPIDSTKTVVTT